MSGDLEELRREAVTVLEMAPSRHDRWLHGEFAFWLWRAGGPPQTDYGIAAPYAYHMAGSWRAAADAWRKIGCPYEEALALADGDEPAKPAALEILERLGAQPAKKKLSQSFH